MTAPRQRDLFTKRWRRVRAPDPKEYQIQVSLITELHLRCRRDVIYFHVPNGELFRDKRVAAKLKAMGTLPGVCDLIFIWPGPAAPQVLFLELKARGRHLTPEQQIIFDKVSYAGVHCAKADSVDAAIAILKSFNLLAR